MQQGYKKAGAVDKCVSTDSFGKIKVMITYEPMSKPKPIKNSRLKRSWKLLIPAAVALLLGFAVASPGWRKLAEGIDYRDLDRSYITPWSHVHVFRVNLKSNQLHLILAKELDSKHASVSQYAAHSNALITINGGFFDKNYQPLGLRITRNQQYSALKRISWWGVFYIKDNKAHISGARQFTQQPDISFAVQSGPRLLINGNIPALKPGRAERSALGITKDGRVIILVTDHSPLSTTELATLMKSPPLNCVDALNLDGGSSSQLHARIKSFLLDVHGFSNVSDAITVLPL